MSEVRCQINAMLFKPVPAGFIFRAPNPWIFGRADHYLVNAQQKAALLGILVAPRPWLRVAALLVGVLLWGVAMATVGWAFSGHEDPTVGDAIIMIVMTLAALFLAGTGQRHLLRPRTGQQFQPPARPLGVGPQAGLVALFPVERVPVAVAGLRAAILFPQQRGSDLLLRK